MSKIKDVRLVGLELFDDLAMRHEGYILELVLDWRTITLENDLHGKTQVTVPLARGRWNWQ